MGRRRCRPWLKQAFGLDTTGDMDRALNWLADRHSGTYAAALIAVVLWVAQDVTALSAPPQWVYAAAVTGVVGILNQWTDTGKGDE